MLLDVLSPVLGLVTDIADGGRDDGPSGPPAAEPFDTLRDIA